MYSRVTRLTSWRKHLVLKGRSRNAIEDLSDFPAIYEVILPHVSWIPRNLADEPITTRKMSYVMQISITANQRTFPTFRENHPQRGTRLANPLHRRPSPIFLRGADGCTQATCHPTHTKRAIPFTLALRIRRICSSDETFKQRTNELKSYLNKRGYNLSFLNQEIERVHNITRTNALNPKDTPTTNQPQRVPLVITYHPALRYVSSIMIFHKHFNILSSSPRCSNVFKAKPLVAFRRSINLSNLLVSAKLRKPATITNQPRGSFRCGKNCLTCNYINDGLTNYTFTVEPRLTATSLIRPLFFVPAKWPYRNDSI